MPFGECILNHRHHNNRYTNPNKIFKFQMRTKALIRLNLIVSTVTQVSTEQMTFSDNCAYIPQTFHKPNHPYTHAKANNCIHTHVQNGR